MNKTTFKKMAVLSTAALFSSALVQAQVRNAPLGTDMDPVVTTTTVETTNTRTDVSADTLRSVRPNMSLFGGSGLVRPLTLGVNAGLSMPVTLGGINLDDKAASMGLGYGAYLEYSLTNWFSILVNYQGGTLRGHYNDKEFNTSLHYALAGKVRLSTGGLSFLQRAAKFGLFLQGGIGYAGYKTNYESYAASRGNQFLSLGLGANYKVSDGITLVLGYDMNFLSSGAMYVTSAQIPDGNFYPTSKWSYLYAGLEFHFGGSGPAYKWYNPVSAMYDELKNRTSLAPQLDSLNELVNGIDTRVDALFRDTDGDGVPDPYDREPNSAPGAVVDGAGRTIVFPHQPVIERVTRITEKEKQVIISLSKNVYFDKSKATLKSASFGKLNEVARILRKNPCVKIRLDGHTDNTGKADFNRKLSQDRVDSVKDYLVRQGSVSASQIEAKGWGETKPLYSNKTRSGREKNRRVEVTVDDSAC